VLTRNVIGARFPEEPWDVSGHPKTEGLIAMLKIANLVGVFAGVIATSGGALASGFVPTISNSFEMGVASKNYDSIITNDDARVTLMGPKFSAADGQTRWLSSSSDLDGVCLLFGYEKAVASALLTDWNFDRTVVIDSSGRFASFRGVSEKSLNPRIASIMCETGAPVSKSSRLEKPPILNDDGTSTLMGPSFGSPDGSVLWISLFSDLNGVCKLYGFGSAIPASIQASGDFERTVMVGGDGRFSSFRGYSYLVYNRRIVSLMCLPLNEH